ncbi:hypothetical protein [Nocardioides jensenii]|nr:hypothetical protein [Nocardioides jensenii]
MTTDDPELDNRRLQARQPTIPSSTTDDAERDGRRPEGRFRDIA